MADPNPDSFVKAMLPFLADPDLSDADKIGLLGLGSWAWDKDHCWPTNAQLAQRCGWLVKGKPSILKAKRTLRRLEAKGRIRRVVVVTDGVPSRPRIELIPPTTDPGSNQTLGGSKSTLPRINNDPTQGQNRPASQVTIDLPPGQNGTVPGSGMTHYIDPVKDSAIDLLQETPPQPHPQRRVQGGSSLERSARAQAQWVERKRKLEAERATSTPWDASDRQRLVAILERLATRHESYADTQAFIKESSRWLAVKLPIPVAVGVIAHKLWNVTRREISPHDALREWAALMVASRR